MITALPFKENVMFGLTHNEDGTPRIRLPRSIKVGIGIPRGKALRVFIHPSDSKTPWYLGEGYYEGKSMKENWHKFATRAECETMYNKLRDKTSPAVPDCSYPRKLKFFTFSKPTVSEKGAEIYEPDFDAIEAHGPTPTKIPIIFTSADVLRMNYQLWSATELRCKGDGINAMRSVLIGSEKDEGWKAAKDAGERYFPIIEGCKERGCPYGTKKECKPGLGINFQTANHYLVGTTASFHTTGYESCQKTFSSFTDIRSAVEKATGRDVSGLGVYLSMRPYVVHPEGQKASTQWSVHVELPLKAQKSIVAQLRAMFEDEAPKQIAAPASSASMPEDATIIDAEEDTEGDVAESPIGAAGMAAEFYSQTEDDEKPAETAPVVTDTATATQVKQDDIGQKLKKQREKADSAPAKTESAPPTAAAVTLPWVNATGMSAVLDGQKERVGSAVFLQIVAKHHAGRPSELIFDSPNSVAIYTELKAAPDAPKNEAVDAGPQAGDIF